MHKVFLIVTLTSVLLAVVACEREQTEERQAAPATAAETVTTGENTDAAVEQQHTIRGRVTALDQDAAEVTIDHSPVESLNWPAMIMPFPVRDPVVLDGVSVGDRVIVIVTENERGEYVIEEIRKDETS